MEPIEKRVDAIFSRWDRTDSPGCALAVVRKGKTVYKRGYGIANLEYGVPITPATVFEAASVSKQFTALAVALLARAGKLSLDDDARRYVPELPDFGPVITIRRLLNHTSGLRDELELIRMAGWRMDDVLTDSDLVNLVKGQRELNFPPGTDYLYCNTGYTLAAVIVERVSGRPFREFCRQTIFEPLGMNSSHFHDDHNELVRNRAYSYFPAGEGKFRHGALSFSIVGACGLFTTAEDMARWAGNFRAGTVGGKDVTAMMTEPGVLADGKRIAYAFGLTVGEYRGLKKIEHSGGIAGFRTHFIYFPESEFAVIILANFSGISPGLLTRQVADVFLERVFPREKDAGTGTGTKAGGQPGREDPAGKIGLYRCAASGETRRVETRDGRLTVAIGPGLELSPLDGGRFRLKDHPIYEFVFVPAPPGGKRRLLEVVGDAPPGVFDEIEEEWRPAAGELDAYGGSYHCPELGVDYLITPGEGDLLKLRRPRYEECGLRPTGKDAFGTDALFGALVPGGLDLIFERGEKGRVRGFRLTSRRVRRLCFHKQ